jgi:hypothetical protein
VDSGELVAGASVAGAVVAVPDALASGACAPGEPGADGAVADCVEDGSPPGGDAPVCAGVVEVDVSAEPEAEAPRGLPSSAAAWLAS